MGSRLSSSSEQSIDTVDNKGMQSADLHDNVLNNLPANTPQNIDGVALVDGQKVFFTNLADPLQNFKVFSAEIVATVITWTAETSQILEEQMVHIDIGTNFGDTIVQNQNGVGVIAIDGGPPTSGPPASETVQGIAELATQLETDTGTDDSRIVTPSKLLTSLPTVSQVDAEAGISIVRKVWTAQRVAQAIAALTPGSTPASEILAGIAELATQLETDTGTDDLRIVTPLKLLTALPTISQVDAEAGISVVRKVWTAQRVAQAIAALAPGSTPASEILAGIAELATQLETDTGADDLRIVTPLKLLTTLPTISQVDAEAGVATVRSVWTAQRIAQAIAALAPVGGITIVADGAAIPVLVQGSVLCLGDATLTGNTSVNGNIYFADDGNIVGFGFDLIVTASVHGPSGSVGIINLSGTANGQSGGTLFVGGEVYNRSIATNGFAGVGVAGGNSGSVNIGGFKSFNNLILSVGGSCDTVGIDAGTSFGVVVNGNYVGGSISSNGGSGVAGNANAGNAGPITVKGSLSLNAGNCQANGGNGNGLGLAGLSGIITIQGNVSGVVSSIVASGGDAQNPSEGGNITIHGNLSGQVVLTTNGGNAFGDFPAVKGGTITVNGMIASTSSINCNGGNAPGTGISGNGGTLNFNGYVNIDTINCRPGSAGVGGDEGVGGIVNFNAGCYVKLFRNDDFLTGSSVGPDAEINLLGNCQFDKITLGDLLGSARFNTLIQLGVGVVPSTQLSISEITGINQFWNRITLANTGIIATVNDRVFRHTGTAGQVWRQIIDDGVV